MISTSSRWQTLMEQTLVPESFVEIICSLTDPTLNAVATVVASPGEDYFSNTASVVKNAEIPMGPKYATLEQNLWILDGSRSIMPDSGEYETPGYVSDDIQGRGGFVVTFPAIQTAVIPGLTITWSSEFNEYPTEIKIKVWGNNNVIYEYYTSDNDKNETVIDQELTGFDKIVISGDYWCWEYHRARIDRLAFGHIVTLDKNDIISYEHEQTGSLVSGELPKHSVSFSISNIDGRWNPLNPTGIGKYLSERQEIIVRYGLDVDGEIEWIRGGKFYLSAWDAPSNGIEASFTARDILEFLMNTKYTAGVKNNQYLTAMAAIDQAVGMGINIESEIDNVMEAFKSYKWTSTIASCTIPEVLQLCANSSRCVMQVNRKGALYIGFFEFLENNGYTIPLDIAYVHPEVTLTKPVKSVSVNWYEDNSDPDEYVLELNSNGEVQTVDNKMISAETQARLVCHWVKDALISRKTVTGEIRANPVLDVYDVVSVETKYGTIENVALTKIKYSYTGSFRGTYEGRVI